MSKIVAQRNTCITENLKSMHFHLDKPNVFTVTHHCVENKKPFESIIIRLTKGKKIRLLTASFLVYIEESIFTSETKRKTLNKIKRLRDKRQRLLYLPAFMDERPAS